MTLIIFKINLDIWQSMKLKIKQSLEQVASGFLLRNWMEVWLLFLDYLLKSKGSPLKNMNELFARDEYQGEAETLPHIHAIISLDWENINNKHKL